MPAERIGFLGLGIMGSRMAANVAAAGYPLTVWTHTPGKAERWAGEHGAAACATPAEVARGSDIVVSMVVDGEQVASVLPGEQGVLSGAAGDCCAWTCPRSAPRTRAAVGGGAGNGRRGALDAPVTGSSPRAEDGTLTIMVGGRRRGVRAGAAAAGDDGPADGARRRARARPDAEGDQQLAGGRQRGRGGRGAAAGAGRRDRPRRAHSKSCWPARGPPLQLEMKARPMREHDYTTLFKTAHCSRTCDCAWRRPSRPACRSRPPGGPATC